MGKAGVMNIVDTVGNVLFTSALTVLKDVLLDAVSKKANLRDANLRDAHLRGADLYGADLRGADLRGADLYGADLYGANLRGADLYGADLRGADLYGADLYGANLHGANLRGADLKETKGSELAIARIQHIPETGSFEAWKKCQNNVLVKLQIPAKAKRSHGSERKCRAEFVKVLQVVGATEGTSIHDGKTKYRKGETVTCDTWNENRWETCGGGIHFFITKAEAEDYS